MEVEPLEYWNPIPEPLPWELTRALHLRTFRKLHEKKLMTELSSALRWKAQLNLDIEPFEFGTLPRYEVKAKRFHDNRGEKA